uniref:Uncharacterized protein n=1 Tax=Ascaris lumbricoides TaxID=6252 RepID=A0A0M3IQA4_ASCLU
MVLRYFAWNFEVLFSISGEGKHWYIIVIIAARCDDCIVEYELLLDSGDIGLFAILRPGL